jgi:hypothetical protein
MPQQLGAALRDKYSWRINQAGIDRAVERAQTLRASLDSAKAGKAPPPSGGRGGLPDGAIPVPVPPGAQPGAPTGAPPAKTPPPAKVPPPAKK